MSWQSFTAESMPAAGRPFEVLWHNSDGREVVNVGESFEVWAKYVALHGYPQMAQWRYSAPASMDHTT